MSWFRSPHRPIHFYILLIPTSPDPTRPLKPLQTPKNPYRPLIPYRPLLPENYFRSLSGRVILLLHCFSTKWNCDRRRSEFYHALHYIGNAMDNKLSTDRKYLRNECLCWVHGEWIVARDQEIAWTAKRFSDDLFVPRYDSFPMNPEKRHSFLIFQLAIIYSIGDILQIGRSSLHREN